MLFKLTGILFFIFKDIKDENILINPATLAIKILDLGSATYTNNIPSTLFYGTKKFASPECAQGLPYQLGHQEVWALGSLLYVMLFKADPFRDEKEIVGLEIDRKIRRQRVTISKEAEDAIVSMMSKDPLERITIPDVLNLKFCKDV